MRSCFCAKRGSGSAQPGALALGPVCVGVPPFPQKGLSPHPHPFLQVNLLLPGLALLTHLFNALK